MRYAAAMAAGIAAAGILPNSPAYAHESGVESKSIEVGKIIPNVRKLALEHIEYPGVGRSMMGTGRHRFMRFIIATCFQSGYFGGVEYRTSSDYGAVGEKRIIISVGRIGSKDILETILIDSSTRKVLSIEPADGRDRYISIRFLDEIYDNLNKERKNRSCGVTNKRVDDVYKQRLANREKGFTEWRKFINKNKADFRERKKKALEEIARQNAR